MVNKFTAISLAIIIGYVIMLAVSNQQLAEINFVLIPPVTKPVGIVIAVCIVVSFILGAISSIGAYKKLKNEQGKTSKLEKNNKELAKALDKIKKEYAFQEKKVCFLEDTIKAETVEKPVPPKPPKPKKPLIPYKIKIVKKETKK